jgi:flavorubredoxin
MNAVVVYESLWGNTAAVARAIAEGIGGQARAMSTAEATEQVVVDADLIVCGAPLLGFNLPTDDIRKGIATNPGNPPAPPDLSHPSMHSWLAGLANQHGVGAAFETRIWWSPGSATKPIENGLRAAGRQVDTRGERFVVAGKYGPLKDGELDRARTWGRRLAELAT